MEDNKKSYEELEQEVEFLQNELLAQDAKIEFLEKELYGDPTKPIKRKRKSGRRKNN